MDKTNNKLWIHIFDVFIILMHITYGMSMLKVWILDPFNIPYYIDIISISALAFFMRFDGKLHLLVAKHNIIFLLFIFLYVADIVQYLFFDTEKALLRILFLIDIILFMEYVYSLYLEKRGASNTPVNSITNSFEFFAVYNVIVVILCAVLIFVGIVSPFDNPIPVNGLTYNNVMDGYPYFFPAHLSLSTETMRGLISFNIPVLTGLAHEPHVLLYLIGPAFFLVFRRIMDRPFWVVVWYILFFLVLIISTSTTAIVSFGVVLVVEQLYNIFIHKPKLSNYLVLFLLIGIALWIVYVGRDFFEIMTSQIDSKVNTGNDEGSRGFSYSMLKYMVSPRSLFGLGNMPGETGYALDNKDIGFISCILDLFFVALFAIKAIKDVFNKNRIIHYYGMAFLYFILHTTKMGVQTFSFQYLSFFVVMLIIVDCEKERFARCEMLVE